MRFSKTQITLFLALLAGNAIILYSPFDWTWLRYPAAVALTCVLPGWAWLPLLGWLQTRRAIERIILVAGLSSLFSALALLIVLLLPGPFTETPVLIALNLVSLVGLISQSLASGQSTIEWPARTVLLILLAILAVAAVTRLTRLGYAEFHEDELENMRLIVRAFKGEEYAPFLDSKGPIHWLLPAALWYLNGWLNEAIARTPVALTSLLLVPTMFVLGRRLSGERDSLGLAAAGFVALNGFFVAYARHVENQSLIVFWGTLGMWFAYRYYQESLNHFLLWLALVLAVGLIAHPDMLLYLPVFGYIIWRKVWPNRTAWRQQWPWLAGASLVFVGLVTLFYLPYLTDPDIALVYQYFGEERIGTSLLYNRVANVFDQDALYTSRYHMPILLLLLLWLLARNFAQWRWRGWAVLMGLIGAMVSTILWPEAWLAGRFNLAFVPYALLTLLFILLPRTSFELKTLFLWFIVPLGALVFLAQDAADHVQIVYPAWALLSAFALTDLWDCLSQRHRTACYPSQPCPLNLPHSLSLTIKSVMVLGLTLVTALILFYQYLAFDSPVTTYWHAKIDSARNPDSLYNKIYGSIPRPRKIFSNPRLGGWKVVGYLWETGVLSGDFRSINESFAVPIWYTFQTPRSCYEDPQNYWLRRDWQGWPDEEQRLIEQGYTLTRVVLVDREPKLHLYEKTASPHEPEILDLEDFRHKFDRLATPARFADDEPVGQPTSLNFGDKIMLRGYTLPATTARAGDLLPITVYWDSLAPMDVRYRGFVHLIGPDGTRWGQHDDDPACRLLTTDMRPGQQSSRQFRLPVDQAAPPGEYTIVLGLYDPGTLERLPIWDNLAGQAVGDSLILGRVYIEE